MIKEYEPPDEYPLILCFKNYLRVFSKLSVAAKSSYFNALKHLTPHQPKKCLTDDKNQFQKIQFYNKNQKQLLETKVINIRKRN